MFSKKSFLFFVIEITDVEINLDHFEHQLEHLLFPSENINLVFLSRLTEVLLLENQVAKLEEILFQFGDSGGEVLGNNVSLC